MDSFTPEKRSWNMSRIHSKDTKPEEKVRKYLFAEGFRYRKNYKKLPGKPDIVLPKYKTVIFVNGCFWHGHEGCSQAHIPKSNVDYWQNKIRNNISRDKEEEFQLRKLGWKVIKIWGCELKNKFFEETMTKVVYNILSDSIV